ncbi:MAG TPA: Lrp/AsnC family transcriptional regulator, partial [Deltaproteobacteria bacterium]|nr:Lrp/AsnC family transcriptional regulator [Deltaproteobacteria bacterium]
MTVPNMDDTDRAILNRIQSNFPITSRPYLEVAEELSLGENDVIDRVRHLRKTGI